MYFQTDASVIKAVTDKEKGVKLNENIFSWSSKNA